MAVKVVRLRRSKPQHNATSSKGRRGNEVYRVREHLTEAEIQKLLAALKQNRYAALGISPYNLFRQDLASRICHSNKKTIALPF
jgi:hypothetical protein